SAMNWRKVSSINLPTKKPGLRDAGPPAVRDIWAPTGASQSLRAVIPGRASSREPGIPMRWHRTRALHSGFAPEEGASRNDEKRMERGSHYVRSTVIALPSRPAPARTSRNFVDHDLVGNAAQRRLLLDRLDRRLVQNVGHRW